jgi:hypothetical protein
MAQGFPYNGTCYPSYSEFYQAWIADSPTVVGNTVLWKTPDEGPSGNPAMGCLATTYKSDGTTVTGFVDCYHYSYQWCTVGSGGGNDPLKDILGMSAEDSGLITAAIVAVWVVGWIARQIINSLNLGANENANP